MKNRCHREERGGAREVRAAREGRAARAKSDAAYKSRMCAIEKSVAAVSGMHTDANSREGPKVEVPLDSGAGASCWTTNLTKKIPMGPKVKGVKFGAASGTELRYYGTMRFQLRPKQRFKKNGGRMDGSTREVNLHVTGATHPLAAAVALAKMGNRIAMEDGPGISFIENLATGDKVMLRESGGAFVVDVECAVPAGKTPATFSSRG